MTASLLGQYDWLIEGLVKGTVFLLLAAIASMFKRQTSASLRHFIWCGALLGAMLIPLFSGLLPEWRVSWVPAWSEETTPVFQNNWVTSETVENTLSGASLPEGVTTSSASQENTIKHGLPLAYIAGLVWFCGLILASIPIVGGYFQIWQITRNAEPVTSDKWLAVLSATSQELRLRVRVQLLSSEVLAMPMTWGMRRAAVLLPKQAEDWPPKRRRMVLLHELAHVQRRDWLTQTIANMACAIYWFNPLFWMAARSMRTEREKACDDLVIGARTKPSDYAEELLGFAAHSKSNRLLRMAAVPMARHTSIEGRLLALLDAKQNRKAVSPALLLGGIVAIIICVMPAAMLRAAEDKRITYVFDKTFERAMHPNDQRYLDLESGRQVETVPPGDLYLDATESDLRARNGRNMAVVFVSPEKWESSLPNDVLRRLNNEKVEGLVRLGGEETKRTAFFKTAEGRVGIINISPHEKQAGVVLIKYKLLRPKKKFNEKVISLSSGEKDRFISLEELKSYAEKPGNTAIVYLDNIPDLGECLVVENAHNYPTEKAQGNKRWETMTAEEIAEPAGLAGIPFERNGFYPLKKDRLPMTILIPQYGLLQVSEIDSRTGQVIVKYRQVEERRHKRNIPQMSAKVVETLRGVAASVELIRQGIEGNQIPEIVQVFELVNEHCDFLQGKNQNIAPKMEEWGIQDANRFKSIMETLGRLENDAEGMRSIAGDKDANAVEKEALIKRLWKENFAKNYSELLDLIRTEN